MITTTNLVGAVTRDVLSAVVRIESAWENPLYSMLLAGNRVLDAESEKVEWYTTEPGSRRTQVNNGGSAYDASTTAIVVDDGTVFMAGDQIIFEATGEIALVQSVSSNTITVSRGIGSVAAAIASVANDAYIMNIGNASGEGSDSPGDSAAGKTLEYNYLQTFRRAVQLSGRVNRTRTITEDEKGFQRAEALKRIGRDIEHALMFGARSNTAVDASGNKVTTMGGLREMVTTHVSNISGTLSKSELKTFASGGFDTGSPTKYLFAGPTLITAISDLYDGQRRISEPVASVGLRVTTIETDFGQIKLLPHRNFRGAFAGDGMLVDVESLKLRPTSKEGGGRLQLKEGTQTPGKDATRDEFFAEHSLEFDGEQNHAQIRGVTGADLS